MNVPVAIVDRILAYQVECTQNGSRPHFALFGVVAAIARNGTTEPIGLRRLSAATGMTDQGVLNLLEVGKELGVILEVRVGKRPKYVVPQTLNSVEQSSDNAQLSRAVNLSVEPERSTQLDSELSVDENSYQPATPNAQLSRALPDASSVDTSAGAQWNSPPEIPEVSNPPLPPVEEGAAEPPPPLTADGLYHALTNRHLPNEIRPTWDKALAARGPDRMREVVVCWRAAGFSPINHKGQLDWMRKGIPVKHRLESDTTYEAKETAAELAATKGNGNGYSTKTDRNSTRLREVAEDIARLRGGNAGEAGEIARDHHERLLGDGPRGSGQRGADLDRFSLGGDRIDDPDLKTSGFVH